MSKSGGGHDGAGGASGASADGAGRDGGDAESYGACGSEDSDIAKIKMVRSAEITFTLLRREL